jgi:alkylhydroperoxidase family enzyme
MTAESLPKTTAMMLQLDYAQRALSPLDPKLRAAMRYVIARANHCEYAAAYALADARRAGLSDSAAEALGEGDVSGWTPDEKAALGFARTMSVASATVTDDEFASLVKAYGEKGAAAMVLLAAYGNFQDRLLICLRAPIEDGGPRPPAEFVFKIQMRSKVSGLVSKGVVIPTLPPPTGKDVVEDDPDWAKVTFEELQDRMERQRNRATRVRIPTWEEVQAAAPEYYPAGTKPVRVVWGLVCAGLQPRLAVAWNSTMWTFWAEAAGVLPPAFSHSIFWVTTRAVDCPYCMGHCEMILELNGLTRSEIDSRSRMLAGEDWSSFLPEEQRTFAFARKLAYAPATVAEDVETIKRDFGDKRAMTILWNACHGHYMVRVSNGFQLSLERDNVFRERLEGEESAKSDAAAKSDAPANAEAGR